MSGETSKRRACSSVATALGFCMLGLAFGATQSLRRHHVGLWLERVRLEQAARDLACSALEEANHELMLEVNRPGAPVFEALRGPVGAAVAPVLKLPHTRALAARWPELELAQVTLAIPARRPLLEALPFEWVGVARTTAVVSFRVGGRASLEAVSVRELRASCVAPVPFDRSTLVDLGALAAGAGLALDRAAQERIAPALELLGSAQAWQARASLRIAPDGAGSVQSGFEVLARRLGRLDGIVLVDNAGRGALSLRNRAFSGRCVLVVTGAVDLADVRLADPACDLLTVIACGDARLEGRLEGAVLLMPGRAGSNLRRTLADDLRVRGALVVPDGALVPASVRVEPLDTLVATDAAGHLRADRIHVSVSPNLLRHSITANVP